MHINVNILLFTDNLLLPFRLARINTALSKSNEKYGAAFSFESVIQLI